MNNKPTNGVHQLSSTQNTEYEGAAVGDTKNSSLTGATRDGENKMYPKDTMTNPEDTASYITLITDSDGWTTPVQWQIFDDVIVDGKKRSSYGRILYGSLQEHLKTLTLENAQGRAICITVNEIHGQARKIDAITRVRAIFADCDADKYQGPLKLQPAFIVRRGENFHPYFPVVDMPLEEFTPTMRSVSESHGTDRIIDLSRAMRAPGFNHWKTGRPIPVTLEIVDSRLAYTTHDIQSVYPPVVVEPKKRFDIPLPSATLDISDRIELAMNAKNGDKFRRLWYGDMSDYPDSSGRPDHTRADIALIKRLLFWFGPSGVDAAFRSSALIRPKWDEKHFSGGETYGEMTIQTALSTWDGVEYTPFRPLLKNSCVKDNRGLNPKITHLAQVEKWEDRAISILTENCISKSSTTSAYLKLVNFLALKLREPSNVKRTEEGRRYLCVGGTLAMTSESCLGRRTEIKTRMACLQDLGFIAGFSNLDGPKSEVVVWLPEDLMDLPIFRISLEASKSLIFAIPQRKRKHYYKKRTVPKPTPITMRSARSFMAVIGRTGVHTVENLIGKPWGEKTIERFVAYLESLNIISVSESGVISADIHEYNRQLQMEFEGNATWRNRQRDTKISSLRQVNNRIRKLEHTETKTMADIEELKSSRKRATYYQMQIDRIDAGEPIYLINKRIEIIKLFDEIGRAA